MDGAGTKGTCAFSKDDYWKGKRVGTRGLAGASSLLPDMDSQGRSRSRKCGATTPVRDERMKMSNSLQKAGKESGMQLNRLLAPQAERSQSQSEGPPASRVRSPAERRAAP